MKLTRKQALDQLARERKANKQLLDENQWYMEQHRADQADLASLRRQLVAARGAQPAANAPTREFAYPPVDVDAEATQLIPFTPLPAAGRATEY